MINKKNNKVAHLEPCVGQNSQRGNIWLKVRDFTKERLEKAFEGCWIAENTETVRYLEVEVILLNKEEININMVFSTRNKKENLLKLMIFY